MSNERSIYSIDRSPRAWTPFIARPETKRFVREAWTTRHAPPSGINFNLLFASFIFPPIRAPPFVKAVDSGNSPLSISLFLAALRSCSESDYKRRRARYDSFPYFQMFRFRKKRLFSVTGEESTSYTAQRHSTDDKTRGGVSFPICIHGRYVSFRSIRVEWRENSGRHCGANRAPRRLNTPPLFPTYSNARSRNLDTGYLHLDPGKAFESIR